MSFRSEGVLLQRLQKEVLWGLAPLPMPPMRRLLLLWELPPRGEASQPRTQGHWTSLWRYWKFRRLLHATQSFPSQVDYYRNIFLCSLRMNPTTWVEMMDSDSKLTYITTVKRIITMALLWIYFCCNFTIFSGKEKIEDAIQMGFQVSNSSIFS